MPSTTGRVPMTAGEDHHHGFNKALEQALKQMGDDFEPGTHTVQVHHQLEVDVKSPGAVGFYSVRLST
jgi:hypothetical protein